MRNSPAVIVLLLLFALSVNTFAKSLKPGGKGGHEADIYAVLPFEKCEKISTMILTIHNNIDFPIGYFTGLRDAPHQDFTWHKYGHRVFFHWGFNANPKNSKILHELVTERNWSTTVEQQFWDKVIQEQARRNKESMTIVGSTLGFDLSGKERAYANAFAAIITDIHILGDYSTTKIETLQEISSVVADIKKALFESLQGGVEAIKINQLLDYTSTVNNPKQRAVALLATLEEHLPSFFLTIQNGYFLRHFTKLKIPVKKDT